MQISPSKKILLITENQRIALTIKSVASPYQLEIDEEFLNLSSIANIRRAIKNTRNTTFLRSELLRFMKEKGFPHFIALDYRIDTGLGIDFDPDQMKILRTILISYMILSKGHGFELLKGNIILLGGNQSRDEIMRLENFPQTILNNLTTRDESINAIINEFKNDQNRFLKLFLIKSLNLDDRADEIRLKLDAFIKMIKARENLIKQQPAGPRIDSSDHEVAKVVYRIDDFSCYVDGEVSGNYAEAYSDLKEKEFYIIGHWTNKTQKELTNKIIKAVKLGLSRDIKFQPDENIVINLTDRCRIDAATTASLAQLIGREISDFKNITIKASAKNLDILQNSTGFQMVRKNVIPMDY